MLTRRNFLTRAIAAGVILRSRLSFAKASQPATPVNFDIPPRACDSHTHFYGDLTKFPILPQHTYTPEPIPIEEMLALHRALHMERVVIVTPSIYGTDNSTTLYAVKAHGDSDLDTMGRAGIRGIRIIAGTAAPVDPAAPRRIFQTAAERMKSRNWNIELYTSLKVLSSLKDLIQTSPVPVVIDHFGAAQAALGLQQPGFADLLDLVRSGKAYVKISGAYRSSTQGPDYPDVAPFAKALIAANADRILWASDWPHPNVVQVANPKPTDPMGLFQIDDGRLLNQLPVWAPDQAIRKKILVDNPARLYGF